MLVLAATFLAALDLMNLVLLGRARDALDAAEQDRARARGREVALALGPASLAASGAGDEASLRKAAVRFDLDLVAVLDPGGAVLAASGPGAAAAFAGLGDGARAALGAGRAAARGVDAGEIAAEPAVAAFVPLLDASGALTRILVAVHQVPELGAMDRRFRTLLGVQVAGVGLIVLIALLFARWVSRPYRAIVAAAGDAGLALPAGPAAAGPDELAEAFRAVAAKLREQEAAMGSLGRERGGLGEIVRFAAAAGRGMATGLLVLDRRGRVAAMNPAVEALLGVPAEAARGRDVDDVRHVEGLRELVAACLDRGTSASREVLRVSDGEGRVAHLGVAVSPATGFDGEVAGALVLMTDLTEIRKVQEQARLRESLASVGSLAAGIAHEFRNALATILGWARMLEKRDDPRVRGPAREILKEIDVVRASLDEFLLYARPPDPARQPVNLALVLRACQAAAPEGTVVTIEGEFGTVTGDEGLLRRAFSNLLQNAVDAGHEAGRSVSVRIAGRRSGSGRHLMIDVEDDGPGIPADRRAHVFQPFFTTRARGTGLGLALVARTIQDMGGSVEVVDGPRGGACFRLRLPLEPAAAEAAPNPERHES